MGPSYDPEGSVGNSGVLGRSIAFTPNGDGLYFVTQQHIWPYLVGSTAELVKVDSMDASKGSYDNNKLLMYGAGAAAIGLFGWMLTR